MNWDFDELIQKIRNVGTFSILLHAKHGIERECFRIQNEGELSQKPHPSALGSAMMNPYFTTDGFEAQLEIVTLPENQLKHALQFLSQLHVYTHHCLDQEHLWPASMPPQLPHADQIIPSYFGDSALAHEKHLYSDSITLRYGKVMHTMSGIHYNFSLSEELWEFLEIHTDQYRSHHFESEAYLHIARNYFRMGWILTYLFGASPACDKSFKQNTMPCQEGDTYLFPWATSLRNSRWGYSNRPEIPIEISFNSFSKFVEDFTFHLQTPHPFYKSLGQINHNLLLSESEFYSPIKPKRIPFVDETFLQAIKTRGIEYLEIRSLDINPFQPTGVDEETLTTTYLLLLYCLLRESPEISIKEKVRIKRRWNQVALEGRKPNSPFQKPMLDILDKLQTIASVTRVQEWNEIVKLQRDKVMNPEKTPSGRILLELYENQESFHSFGSRYAKLHRDLLMNVPLESGLKARLKKIAEESLSLQKELDQYVPISRL